MLETTSMLLEDPASGAGADGAGAGGGVTSASVDAAANLEEIDGVGGGGGGDGGGSVSGGFIEGERGREEEGDRNFGGNRWPREETLALLNIRSEMDVAFRDGTPKAPLWDEVSRKLAELGYHRNSKKCKEKFENIYKYHKRTKEGRSGRQNGKNYRFFEQLEVFDSQASLTSPCLSSKSQTLTATDAVPTTAMSKSVVLLRPPSPSVSHQEIVTPSCSIQNPNSEFMSTSTSTTSSSGKESEGNAKKKRKLADYFERLMKEMLSKQEDLQKKFIEAMEKCEQDRIAREESWKMQEMARMKKEQEVLAQERAITAAKDAAVIAFLQKISDQAIPVQLQENPTPKEKIIDKLDNGVRDNLTQLSPSRWPKAEVEALIRLRTNLDFQYHDNGSKGPLWEEISAAMKKLGYDRSAKRCKEKWENINKYYKRVKESNKKRPEDSKTCPYFHLLESVYENKSRRVNTSVSSAAGNLMKPEDILMQMMGQHQQQSGKELLREDGGVENLDQDQDQEDEYDDEDEDENDNDDNDNGDDYEIVGNNPSSGTTME